PADPGRCSHGDRTGTAPVRRTRDRRAPVQPAGQPPGLRRPVGRAAGTWDPDAGRGGVRGPARGVAAGGFRAARTGDRGGCQLGIGAAGAYRARRPRARRTRRSCRARAGGGAVSRPFRHAGQRGWLRRHAVALVTLVLLVPGVLTGWYFTEWKEYANWEPRSPGEAQVGEDRKSGV